MAIGLGSYLAVAAIVFTIGVFGIFMNRKNVIVMLMSIGYYFSTMGLDSLMVSTSLVQVAPVFAFGLVAFGFLGMGPVTMAWLGGFAIIGDLAPGYYLTLICVLSLSALLEIRRTGANL